MRFSIAYCLLLFVWHPGVGFGQPFAIELPPDANPQPTDLELTVFAEGLDYPVGMEELSDGSVMVAVSDGSFFNPNGKIIRLVDTNFDGIADEQSTLATVPIGGLSDLRIANDLVFVTGQKKHIQVYRLGDHPSDPLVRIDEIQINYPAGPWLHPHSALLARPAPEDPASVELYFQVGSDANFRVTERIAGFSAFGLEGTMKGDSIYRVKLSPNGLTYTASDLTQIATGLRNAAGLEFDRDGNLYFQDNGIDGFIDPNEPTSADELNFLAANAIGGEPEDYGFPGTYTEYRTNELIGGEGILPVVAFQPLGDPPSESEGPNDIAFAPDQFPDYMQNSIFVTMHGIFSSGGVENEENPLVYVDLDDQNYFHFISNEEPNIGHIDGLLTTANSLYMADISDGGFGGVSNSTGKIYKLRSTLDDRLADVNRDGRLNTFDAELFCSLSPSERVDALAELNSALGDLNLDGEVSFADFLILSRNFGASQEDANYGVGDIDCDGFVAFADFLVLSTNFGIGAVSAVPEPYPVIWHLFCLSLLFRSRRRCTGINP